ncbi:MAG: aldose 1-epimerase family protein [Eubacteriales bacterium]|nr:aldose 1-epimerase family protein [Eubacteriales bacterium]
MYEKYMTGKSYWKEALPSMSAFADAKEYELLDGAGSTVRAVHMYTGSGLDFWVYPGRGLDIGEASYNGAPVSYVTKNGVKNPAQLWAGDFERNFFAGLLTTCGLDNAGGACEVDGDFFPTHGRLNLTPAQSYTIKKYWEEEKYFVECSGQVRLSALFGENLVLRRRIRIQAGVSKIFLKDEIVNEGYVKAGYMLLYHCNFGYPVVSDDSVVVTNHRRIEYLDEQSEKLGRDGKELSAPVPGQPQSAFTRWEPKEGRVKAAVINTKLRLGAAVECDGRELDRFCEWMSLASNDYAVGLEPGKNGPDGRKKALEDGTVIWLGAQQTHTAELEFKILADDQAEEYLAALS